MSERLLLDTDVIVDYLRDHPDAVDFLEARTEILLVSAVSVAELFAGVREGRERTALRTFLSAFEVVSVDQEIAERAGLFRRDFGKSQGTGLADAMIASCAEQANAQLVSLNVKHFPMLANVLVPYRKQRPA